MLKAAKGEMSDDELVAAAVELNIKAEETKKANAKALEEREGKKEDDACDTADGEKDRSAESSDKEKDESRDSDGQTSVGDEADTGNEMPTDEEGKKSE